MLLRGLPDLCRKSSACRSVVRRCFSKSASTCKDNDKTNEYGSLPSSDAENTKLPTEKFKYPELNVKPRVINFPYDEELDENPIKRTGRVLMFDYYTVKAKLQQKPPPPTPSEADVLIIGGGVVGSAIAHQLVSRCGHGLRVTVLEKDTPVSFQVNIGLGIPCGFYILTPNAISVSIIFSSSWT